MGKSWEEGSTRETILILCSSNVHVTTFGMNLSLSSSSDNITEKNTTEPVTVKGGSLLKFSSLSSSDEEMISMYKPLYSTGCPIRVGAWLYPSKGIPIGTSDRGNRSEAHKYSPLITGKVRSKPSNRRRVTGHHMIQGRYDLNITITEYNFSFEYVHKASALLLLSENY